MHTVCFIPSVLVEPPAQNLGKIVRTLYISDHPLSPPVSLSGPPDSGLFPIEVLPPLFSFLVLCTTGVGQLCSH